MGIQINGQTDRISAVDGSFSIQDLAEVNVTGVATASNFKTGTSNVHSTGYECANINATGIVTAASANFTGNVSVGGTLTYQDVTNIDSVGIVTARAGVKVPDNQKVFLGTDSDLEIYHDGTDSWIDNTQGDLYLRTTGSGDDIIIRAADDVLIQTQASEGAIIARGDGQVELYHNNVKKLETTSAGATITNDLVLNHASGDKAIRWATGGTNKWSLYHNNSAGALVAYDNANNAERLRIDSAGNIGIGENSPDRLLHLKAASSTAYSGGSDTADYNFLKIENTTNDKSAGIFFQIGGNGEAAITATEVADGNTDIAFQNRGGGVRSEKLRITSAGLVGVNETSPDTNLHISRSANQNDTHGILKVESTSTGTGAATNASIITKNRYGWSQFMQWEENGLRIGSRSTSTGGTGTVTVTYGSDNTGAVINQNGVVTMPQQCGFHVVLHTSQTLTNNGMVNLWDTDASDSRSYIKNMTFNAGRFVAPVSGLYYFTAQLLLSGVASNDDNIHIAWTTGSGNDTFAYWNTRHDGASANGSYGYGGYLPVCGSTTVYLAANAIFGIRANFTGGIGIHGTDANWGHWSGFLVG